MKKTDGIGYHFPDPVPFNGNIGIGANTDTDTEDKTPYTLTETQSLIFLLITWATFFCLGIVVGLVV